MTIGLIGKKIGMTREFFDSGVLVPVTVLLVERGRILDVITKDKRGYDAIQVGFGKIKTSKVNKQMKGFFAKKARGSMASFVIKNKIKDPENLKNFSGLGYTFDSCRSNDKSLVFIR